MTQDHIDFCLATVQDMEASLAALRETLTSTGGNVRRAEPLWRSYLPKEQPSSPVNLIDPRIPETSMSPSIEDDSWDSVQLGVVSQTNKSASPTFRGDFMACGDFMDEAIRHESDEASCSSGEETSSSEEEPIELEFSEYSWFSWAKEVIKHAPALHPDHKIRIFWNMFGLLCILFEAFNIPLVLAFDYQATGYMLAVLALVDLYFILDLPMNFLTGYVAENGKVVMSKRIMGSACLSMVAEVCAYAQDRTQLLGVVTIRDKQHTTDDSQKIANGSSR